MDERARLWRVSGLVNNKPLEKAAKILVYDTACYLSLLGTSHMVC